MGTLGVRPPWLRLQLMQSKHQSVLHQPLRRLKVSHSPKLTRTLKNTSPMPTLSHTKRTVTISKIGSNIKCCMMGYSIENPKSKIHATLYATMGRIKQGRNLSNNEFRSMKKFWWKGPRSTIFSFVHLIKLRQSILEGQPTPPITIPIMHVRFQKRDGPILPAV